MLLGKTKEYCVLKYADSTSYRCQQTLGQSVNQIPTKILRELKNLTL